MIRYYNDNFNDGFDVWQAIIGFLLGLIACLLISLGFSSCRSGKEVFTEKIDSSLIINNYLREIEKLKENLKEKDSTYTKDSVIIMIKGDTVFKEKYKEKIRWKYKDRLLTDTVYKDRVRDSIQTVYKDREVVKVEKVNKLYWWQKTLIYFGGAGLIGGLILLGIKLKRFIL